MEHLLTLMPSRPRTDSMMRKYGRRHIRVSAAIIRRSHLLVILTSDSASWTGAGEKLASSKATPAVYVSR